jgi:hypothetical protein
VFTVKEQVYHTPPKMLFAAIPLIIVFSLCYAATRHEEMKLILPHAARFGFWLAFFMALAVVIMESVMYFNS